MSGDALIRAIKKIQERLREKYGGSPSGDGPRVVIWPDSCELIDREGGVVLKNATREEVLKELFTDD